MKRIKKWRYYCDYCKKSGCSGGHMKRHEASCTMNPNRICGMCRVTGEEQPQMVDMIKTLNVANIKVSNDDYGQSYMVGNEKEALGKLREAANGCPACMLAALRQSGYSPWFCRFRFAEEVNSFWRDVHQAKIDSSM